MIECSKKQTLFPAPWVSFSLWGSLKAHATNFVEKITLEIRYKHQTNPFPSFRATQYIECPRNDEDDSHHLEKNEKIFSKEKKDDIQKETNDALHHLLFSPSKETDLCHDVWRRLGEILDQEQDNDILHQNEERIMELGEEQESVAENLSRNFEKKDKELSQLSEEGDLSTPNSYRHKEKKTSHKSPYSFKLNQPKHCK